MGSFFFQGNGPFELAIQREPTVTAEGEDVVVTLPVLIAGPPITVFPLRVPLSIQQAKSLSYQIESVLIAARKGR